MEIDRFIEEEIHEILDLTVMKCKLKSKGVEYIPLLFEDELKDRFAMIGINKRGELNYEKRNP